MAGILGIYGVVVAVLLSGGCKETLSIEHHVTSAYSCLIAFK
jgi:hypothetical protein